MDVTSLGYRTDLARLILGGSQIEDRGDHLVIRSPHNPLHWWGNFLLLAAVPDEADTGTWLARFAAEFPAARHLAFGFDGVDGRVEDLAGFTERGLRCEASTVLSATVVNEPARPNRDATYRLLTSDDDWAQSVELRIDCDDELADEEGHREFATLDVGTKRSLVQAGHGGWFGAFVEGRLVSQMGLFSASAGLARFASVETHPDFRGRGLAGTLVHQVSQFGFDRLGARTLVMVADPDYLAVRIYRALGFCDGERQLQAERAPSAGHR